MHKNYYLEVIGEKPALFAAMLRFNGIAPPDGATTPPDDVVRLYADLPAACLDELWRHEPSRKHLRSIAQNRAEPFWDFSEESRCLALLEPDILNELILFYGASLHAPEIKRTIMGRDLARLREALSERAYAYALQRGQYQMPAGRGVFAARHPEKSLAERVLLHGREALGIIVSGWPRALQNRVHAAPPAGMAVSSDLQRGIWFDMKKILLKEVASAWAPCFA
jgi:hypothetical protein